MRHVTGSPASNARLRSRRPADKETDSTLLLFAGSVIDGKIVGAIGMSGGTGPQDAQCANAAVAALK